MALGTFGAIMEFAAKMVRRAEDTYKDAIENVNSPTLKDILRTLMEEERKNFSLIDQMRRENLTEMILEPIIGVQQQDYEINIEISRNANDTDLLKVALIFEEKEQKFFSESSIKIPFPEVSKAFRKIAQRKEKNLAKLASLDLT